MVKQCLKFIRSAFRFPYKTRSDGKLNNHGTIHCELLVHERGSWVALPVYLISEKTIDGRLVVSGYVESQTNQKFRALLTYTHPSHRRTALWHLPNDTLCSMYIDGRTRPVSEHTIHKNANENPVDLTGYSATGHTPFANVPTEATEPFSWRERDSTCPPIEVSPDGSSPSCIREHSCLSLKLSACRIHRVIRDKAEQGHFPSSDPSPKPHKRDKRFEPNPGCHKRLSHYIHIESAKQDYIPDDACTLIPAFSQDTQVFAEFKFYYKSRELLQEYGLACSDIARPRRGLASSKSLNNVAPISAGSSAVNTPQQSSARGKRGPKQLPVLQSLNQASRSRLSKYKTSIRPSATQSPSRTTSISERLPTPFYGPEVSASKKSSEKRPGQQPTSLTTEPPAKKVKISTDKPPDVLRERDDVSSLPSPPASPIQSAASVSSKTATGGVSSILPKGKDKSPCRAASSVFPSTSVVPKKRQAPQTVSPTTSLLQKKINKQPSPSRTQVTQHTAQLTDRPLHTKQAVPRLPLTPSANLAKAIPEQTSTAAAKVTTPRVANDSASGEVRAGSSKAARPELLAAEDSAISQGPTDDASLGSLGSTAAVKMEAAHEDLPAQTSTSSAQATTGPSAISPPRHEEASAAVPATPSTGRVKPEDTSSAMKVSASRSQPTSKSADIVDLTLDSGDEGEVQDEKKMVVKSGSAGAPGDTLGGASSGPGKAELVERKSASDHALVLLEELDIYDVGNITALISVGYKSTATFIKRLPLLDASDRRNILEELTREMGKLDFGILRGFLKRQGVDVEN